MALFSAAQRPTRGVMTMNSLQLTFPAAAAACQNLASMTSTFTRADRGIGVGECDGRHKGCMALVTGCVHCHGVQRLHVLCEMDKGAHG